MKPIAIFLILSSILLGCSDAYLKNFETSGINNSPEGALDFSEYKDGVITAKGWSADKEDGAPIEKVMIYVDNKVLGKVTKKGIEREDVVKFYNKPAWIRSGWEIEAIVPLTKGKHMIFAVSYDKAEAFSKTAEKEFTIK
jgi:hypothetical protein